MGLTKQAKTLTDAQFNALLGFVREQTRFPKRNAVIVLCSFKAGMRSQEIAGLTWGMLTDASGTLRREVRLENTASRGDSGRVIPLHPKLYDALADLHRDEAERGRTGPDRYVITLAKGNEDLKSRARSIQFLFNGKGKQIGWFKQLGFEGCSSHTGRRTFITNAARLVSSVGGSMREVQELAGHTSLAMTQRYVEVSEDAKKKLVARL